MAAAAERRSEAASGIEYLDAASSDWWLAACHVAVIGMAAHSKSMLRPCMVMMVGATPGLGGASEDDFEAIGQHGDKERCGRPHAGRQSGLNRGAALGA